MLKKSDQFNKYSVFYHENNIFFDITLSLSLYLSLSLSLYIYIYIKLT